MTLFGCAGKASSEEELARSSGRSRFAHPGSGTLGSRVGQALGQRERVWLVYYYYFWSFDMRLFCFFFSFSCDFWEKVKVQKTRWHKRQTVVFLLHEDCGLVLMGEGS